MGQGERKPIGIPPFARARLHAQLDRLREAFLAEHEELLEHSFPFAAFNGAWLVLPCKGQNLDRRLARPVISVLEGIDVHFYSLQLMVDTCVEWMSHPQYDPHDHLPEDVEMEIWRRHNPGIFQ